MGKEEQKEEGPVPTSDVFDKWENGESPENIEKECGVSKTRGLYPHGNVKATSPRHTAAPNTPEEQPNPALVAETKAGDTTTNNHLNLTGENYPQRLQQQSIPKFNTATQATNNMATSCVIHTAF